MPTNPKYKAPLLSGYYYHVFTKANPYRNLFENVEDVKVFLSLFKRFLRPYLEVYAYCLIPNHLHFLVKLKDDKNIQELIAEETDNQNMFYSRQFQRLFVAFTTYKNNKENVKGALYSGRFKRIIIDKDSYFTQVIRYIHCNPVHHKMSKSFHDYPYSSYKEIINALPAGSGIIKRAEVIEWFGNVDKVAESHEEYNTKYNLNTNFSME